MLRESGSHPHGCWRTRLATNRALVELGALGLPEQRLVVLVEERFDVIGAELLPRCPKDVIRSACQQRLVDVEVAGVDLVGRRASLWAPVVRLGSDRRGLLGHDATDDLRGLPGPAHVFEPRSPYPRPGPRISPAA
jgi:hypothetical protein